MVTKAVVQSINASGTRCVVRMPLFESSASSAPIEAEALINITPGIFNNLVVGDIVFVAFEENALEKPIILGKLFRGADVEGYIRSGGGIFNTIKVTSDAALPASTSFTFPASEQNNYKDLKTPKKIADYIKWLESFTKQNIIQLDSNFRCFKNWAQWQFKPENIELDDGDLDEADVADSCAFLYQEEGKDCKICEICSKDNIRRYLRLASDKNYPDI